jgi:hypothetical protein
MTLDREGVFDNRQAACKATCRLLPFKGIYDEFDSQVRLKIVPNNPTT